MLYEIHMLKNYPPTNLNRDDTGAPKTCIFGGVTRGRISSQCLKRSWRTSDLFISEVGENQLGIRTRGLPELVAERLRSAGIQESFIEEVMPILADIVKSDKNGQNKEENEEYTISTKKDATTFKTKQLVFYSSSEIELITELVKSLLATCKAEKEVKKTVRASLLQNELKKSTERPINLDIALFGRMVTSDAFRNVEASMQVAHAISTNKISVESDYFTAMDDRLNGGSMDEMGAGMINDTDYNASCYYLYASLDTDQLRQSLMDAENADQIIARAIPALLRAMAYTNPSGKQNSFAGHVLPSCFMIECKEKKIPVSLVNAFVEPVKGQDIVAESIRKLAAEADMTDRCFGLPVKERLWFCADKYSIRPECATRVCASFPELVKTAAALLI